MANTDMNANFANIGELRAILSGMDDYEVLPAVVYHEKFPEGITGKIGVMTNVTKHHHCMSTSMEYPVFDHKTAFGFAASAIEKRGAGIHGSVKTWKDRAYLTAMFDEIKLVDGKLPDGGDSIVELGFHLENSMDRKTAFKGDGYTTRLVCANGAKAQGILPGFLVHEWHTVDMNERVPPVIEAFTNGLLARAGYLQDAINVAMDSKVKFETRESLEATMIATYEGISDRHVKKIVEQIAGLEPSRWDLFNAASYYNSHNEKLSPDVRSDIDAMSAKFLNMSAAITPVVPTPEVRQVA
ncbi:MAG TPA: hypothetical protein PLW50_00105 [Smithellaceae bacterium]|jgi:hypothetical protein|nr:hypothetical protein [Smithellaceae bacterium]